MKFEIQSNREKNGIAVLELSGELDMESYPLLREKFLQTCQSKLKAVVIDLSQVTYINSYGLSAFTEGMNQTGFNRLRLVGVSPGLRKIFDMAMMSSLMEFCESRTDAFRGIR